MISPHTKHTIYMYMHVHLNNYSLFAQNKERHTTRKLLTEELLLAPAVGARRFHEESYFLPQKCSPVQSSIHDSIKHFRNTSWVHVSTCDQGEPAYEPKLTYMYIPDIGQLIPGRPTGR